ncbi:hypothetical protein HDU93_000200 [Gonapodya sp. JEL0774]|nr:hypothetical protein HDU93_000200 [Gonapodya sp. JEL0774]
MDVVKEDFDVNAHSEAGTLVLQNIYLSLDPYMRPRMRDPSIPSYSAAFQLNAPLTGGLLSRVIKSNSPDFAAGDVVRAFAGWETYSVVDAKTATKVATVEGVELRHFMGALGGTGMTAYCGLKCIGLDPPKSGETLFVDAAAGATGIIVGQLAKQWGARVVGSAGSDAKVSMLVKELGFDYAFNYKTPPGGSLDAAIKEGAPNGIDFLFENVGGVQFDALFPHLNDNARIAFCGSISNYDKAQPQPISNYSLVIAKRLKIHGFIVSDHIPAMLPAFFKEVVPLIVSGKVIAKDDVRKGLERAPEYFLDLLRGA